MIVQIVGIMIAMMFALGLLIIVGGSIMEELTCDDIDFSSQESAFETKEQCEETLQAAKNNAWLIIVILPIILIFSVIRLFVGYDEFGWLSRKKTYTASGTKVGQKTNNLSIGQKILIMLGMAKVTRK